MSLIGRQAGPDKSIVSGSKTEDPHGQINEAQESTKSQAGLWPATSTHPSLVDDTPASIFSAFKKTRADAAADATHNQNRQSTAYKAWTQLAPEEKDKWRNDDPSAPSERHSAHPDPPSYDATNKGHNDKGRENVTRSLLSSNEGKGSPDDGLRKTKGNDKTR